MSIFFVENKYNVKLVYFLRVHIYTYVNIIKRKRMCIRSICSVLILMLFFHLNLGVANFVGLCSHIITNFDVTNFPYTDIFSRPIEIRYTGELTAYIIHTLLPGSRDFMRLKS